MKKLLLPIVLLASLQIGLAQVVGKQFPDMITESVDDKKITLPIDAKGKYTLLGLAYSKKSEDDLNSWLQPVFDKFLRKREGLMANTGYDVNVYFIPMFTGIKSAAEKPPNGKR
jgi:hypothetical protein